METYVEEIIMHGSPQQLQSLYGTVNTKFESSDIAPIQKESKPINNRARRHSSAERTVRFLSTIHQTLIKSSPNKTSFYIIKRENLPKKIFDIFIIFCAYYSVLSSLAYLGFYSPSANNLQFDYFIWSCFILDFLLKFVTEARSKGKPISDVKEISKKYARTWMLFDILSLLPLHWAGLATTEYWLRLFRVFKLRKLLVLIQMEKMIDYFISKMVFMDHRKTKALTIILNFGWSLFYQILAMLLSSYALACIWLYYTGIIQKNENELEYFQVAFQLDTLSPGAKLVKTWYFIYTTLMTVGYGDLYATNKYEMGFCILLLIIGPTMYAFAMGKSVDTINRLRYVGKDNRRINNFEAWLMSLEANYGKINNELKSKITDHLIYYLKHDKVNILAEKHWNYTSKSDYFQFHNKFLNELPEKLRFQLLDRLFQGIFYKFKFFFGSDNFRFYLCLHIQPRNFKQRTVIIEEDEVPSEILFLETGKVYAGLETENGFQSVYKYKDRSVIGEHYVINRTSSLARYVVRKHFVGFAIPGKVVRQVGKVFKEQFAEILRIGDKKAGLIKTNIEDQFPNFTSASEDFRHVKFSCEKSRPTKFTTKMMKNKKVAEKNSGSEILGSLPKFITGAKRSQRNLLAELNDKMQELFEVSRKTTFAK